MCVRIAEPRGGHVAVLEEFEEVARPVARRFARRFGLAVEDGEDVLQDVLLKLIQRPSLLDGYSSRQHVQKVRWGTIDLARRRSREPVELADDLTDYESPGPRLTVEQQLLIDECLAVAWEVGTAKQCRVLAHFLDGATFEEIGAHLGTSRSAASQVYERLVVRLQQCLLDSSEGR